MRLLRVLLALLLAFGALLAGVPAQAGVVKAFKLNYDQVGYGDFLEVGNGSLRCPTTADNAPQWRNATPAACAGVAAGGRVPQGSSGDYNDDYFMLQADVDGDSDTFNSSRATLRIPPGAKIDFARLNWAGNTGTYDGSRALMCQNRSFIPATVPAGAAASPEDQQVKLTVGEKSQQVSPAALTRDPAGGYTGGGQYYSAYADVTSAFAGAATGSDLSITTGNVWGVNGFGCMAGWSLVVVYKYAERDPVNAPSKREVFVYDGHVRQNSSDAATTVTVTGFRSAAATTRIGVTAYEGDRNISRDEFKVNNTSIPEPGTGNTDNFFVSLADGRSSPDSVNNWSVDAKSFTTTAIRAGATSADLSFVTNGDSYLAQNLVFSVAVPELQIEKSADPAVVHAGEQVTFTITVTNPSGAPASGVKVSDPAFPGCDRVIGALAAGRSSTYTCTGTAPADDVTNVANVTGTSSLGDPLEGTSSAKVDVIHPAITVAKDADKPAYRAGDTVTFTIKVTNSGDVPLTRIQVADAKVPDCARNLGGVLAAGASRTFTCTTTAPVADGVNTATASGFDSLGLKVEASDDAPVPIVRPGIELTKTADPATIRAGDQTTFTITVRNTGDSPLDPVRIADDRTPDCARTLSGALPAGGSQTYTCTARLTETTTNIATATGRDRSGQDVTASAQATVKVLKPAVDIEKTASPETVRAGDTVTFTIKVTNTGDSELTRVTVSDQALPVCAKEFERLAPGASETYTCSTKVSADLVNTATVTGTPPVGPPVTDTDDARVDVINPAIEVTKTAEPGTVRVGDQVTFTVLVRNTGDVPLTNVVVADPDAAGCGGTLAQLAVGAQQRFTCTVTAPQEDFANTATATGTSPVGPPVTDTDTARVDVQHPAVRITKTAEPARVRAGEQVTFTIKVDNTGDVPLTDVRVADPLTPACDRVFASLASGASQTYTCVLTATQDLANVATVTGTPPVGPPVTSTDDAVVDVVNPRLDIEKSAEPGTVRVGDAVTFTIKVTNSGDAPLTSVTVADPAVPACARTLPDLAPGASQSYTCSWTAGSEDLVNTATATGNDPTGRPVTATDDAKVDVIHPALDVSKTADKKTVREGDQVTFTVLVRNTGDVPLTNVVVTDPVAPGCGATIAELPVGGEREITCTMTAPAQEFTNTATGTGTPPVGPPVTDDGKVVVSVLHPGINIAKDVRGGPFREGDTVTFGITVTNTGDAPLTAVSVTDQVAPDCARTLPDLAPGASQTYTCTMTAPANDIQNTASTTGTPPTGPPVSDVDGAEVDVVHPGVELDKSAAPETVRAGDTVTFTIRVRNTGDTGLTAVTVSDQAVPGCARTIDQLAAGETQTYTCTWTAGQDDLVNTAAVTGTPPVGPPVTDTDDATVDVIHPALDVTKTADKKTVREGDRITFTVTVRNTGDVPLTNVVISDPAAPDCGRTITQLAVGAAQQITCTITAPAADFANTATGTGTPPVGPPVTDEDTVRVDVQHPGITITKDVEGGPFRAGDSVTFRIKVSNTGDVPLTGVTVTDQLAPECRRGFPELAVGAVETYPCTMIAPADDVVNTATANGKPPTGPDVSDVDDAPVDVLHPGVTIDKSVSPVTARPGDQVTYTIVVRNTGDVPLTDVRVTDDKQASCGFTLPLLPVDGTETRTCAIAATQDVTNTAAVTGNDPTGRPVTDTDDAVLDVIGPGIEVTKTGPAKPLLTGQDATFTVVVRNTGDVPLTNVVLTDPIAPGCAVTVGNLAPGESSKPVTCTVTMRDNNIENTVTATGTDPTGRPVTDTDQATAKLGKPGIDLTKTADQDEAAPGRTVTFKLTVRNTGTVDLIGVTVADPSLPGCDRRLDRLPVNDSRTWTCTAAAPGSGTMVNTATATGQPDTERPGNPVTDTDSASVRVPGGPTPPPPPLAKTGAAPTVFLWAGLALLALGVVLVAGTRRRRS
ncbi:MULTISPECIES: CARDB domain-containing protein [unclassified Crossiella]|uniref:DUF7507 domain-containing protein n=1 Tax=unclassified Crossiella TaxID=2620835 RepID=UPI001FFF5B7C|nr:MULTISPECIES: CARDB domain-containing protein [unclassified Crossiella]MCK2236430.1 LPXTG cell wall anchor domain-containing protein [Crossiella sp. S99.2]MCK2250097.1 LPXTG cell wall anchor domain-containing protein [Crossiella sp. S99.1]